MEYQQFKSDYIIIHAGIDIEVRCSAHYHYESSTLNNLMAINTTITQVNNYFFYLCVYVTVA